MKRFLLLFAVVFLSFTFFNCSSGTKENKEQEWEEDDFEMQPVQGW